MGLGLDTDRFQREHPAPLGAIARSRKQNRLADPSLATNEQSPAPFPHVSG